jgi:hypothetical protein
MKNTMTNENSFGQRIAATWRSLVEHLEKLTASATEKLSDNPLTDGEGSPQ